MKKEEKVHTQPLSLNTAEAALVRSLWLGNVVTFCVLTAGALLLASWDFAISVMVGGAIALVNFRLLERNIKRALLWRRDQGKVLPRVLVRYYIRFAATAVVLIILVRQGLVDPLGLLVGLSVVVLTIFVWGALQARKLYKEAV